MNYPTTSKKDLYLWMEEKNLQMSQYLEKAENQYTDTANLLDKLSQYLDSGVIAGKETSTFYSEVKSRKDANPAPFDIEEYKAIDFHTIIDGLPD